MKRLPTVNQKSIYATAGEIVADSESIVDPIDRIDRQLHALDAQIKCYKMEQVNRHMDQIDLINHIHTRMRNIEIKNFDEIPFSAPDSLPEKTE